MLAAFLVIAANQRHDHAALVLDHLDGQRFPQRPRNFLEYREARMWVVPREGDFGPDRPLRFFFKALPSPDISEVALPPLRSPADRPEGAGNRKSRISHL